ncbi:E3 ubiquitin-protein ligase RNF166-like [Tubulanus polymorphus]|uniref:E3 ubiquitin-protein ligase RNF166-like n=1 Tax=Tubulanus polymorphus TaxID=672921 RepID=UPI003DA4EE55
MASSMAQLAKPSKNLDDLDNVICAICLEVYQKPFTIACGHIFCGNCVSAYTNLSEPQCPLCRTVFDPKKKKKAIDVDKVLSSNKVICKGCSKKMSLSKLRSHGNHCKALPQGHKKFEPIAKTSQKLPSVIPNRCTFQCPYCGVNHLTTTDLVKHCNHTHKHSLAHVVCPICASMPWGNPSQKSSNFINHLNLRHRFEYDTYVDYSQDDDAMLEAALQASLEEC